MTSTSLSKHYRLIVPDSDGSSILVTLTHEGHILPRWTSDVGSFWQDTRPINRRVQDQLGLTISTLRAVSLDRTSHRRDSYYAVENLDPDWSPPTGMRWIPAADAASLRWQDERDRQVVAEWYSEIPAQQRVDWYKPGWYRTARSWILESLEDAGCEPVGNVEQLRSWERSSIMRIPTIAGIVYFKAVPPQWGYEPALTAFLSNRYPDLMPDVIASDAGNRRMLVREFHGESLTDVGDFDLWKLAYASLGRIQRELSRSIPDLRETGLSVRDLDSVREQVPVTLRDRRRMRVGMDGGLSEPEAERLLAAEERLVEACRRLASGPIPLSLDHGDFWPGNVFASDGRITLIDWSDATISHPFFSLVMASDEIDACLTDTPGAGNHVIDAFLAEWSEYASSDELRAIFDDAMLVAPLHLATMYRTVYLPAMEFVEELDRMTPHFLRWLAARL